MASEKKSMLIEALRIVLPLFIIVVGIGGFLVLAQRKPVPKREVTEKIPVVQTVPVTKNRDKSGKELGLTIKVEGVVVPYREITLAAEVAGRLQYKNPQCRAGRFIQQNTKLFEIDPKNYKLEAEQAKSDLDQRVAAKKEMEKELENNKEQVKVAKDQWELQKKDLKRTLDLFADNAASISDVDAARRAELAARDTWLTRSSKSSVFAIGIERLKGAIAGARAKWEKAKEDRKRTVIRVPDKLNGVVIQSKVEQDDYVQMGTVLVTIEDASAVEVKCNLRMKQLAWLWRGVSQDAGTSSKFAGQSYQLPPAPVQVVFRLGSDEFIWDGVLSRFDGIGVDAKTRTIPCRILVANPRQVRVVTTNARSDGKVGKSRMKNVAAAKLPALVRGMFVQARILAKPRTPLLRLPSKALRAGNVVWRINKQRLETVPVNIAQIQEDFVLVRADNTILSAADRVVVTPLGYAVDGMKIREEKGK